MQEDDPRTRNRIALVTGANLGIGRAVVTTLLRRGDSVFACSRSPLDASIFQPSPLERLHPIVADLSTDNGVNKVQETVGSSALDLFVHCASGRTDPERDKRLIDTPKETIGELLDVSLRASVLLTQALIPALSLSPSASAIYLVSDWALRGSTGPAVFSAVKAGLGHFIHRIRHDLAASGIRVTAIYPGDVATYDEEWVEPIWSIDDGPDAVVSKLGFTRIPLSEIVAAIEFAADRRYARVEEIVIAPLDPEYRP